MRLIRSQYETQRLKEIIQHRRDCIHFQTKIKELKGHLQAQIDNTNMVLTENDRLEEENEKLRLRLVFMDHLWHSRNKHIQYRERCEDMQCCENAIALFGKPSMSAPERKQYDNYLKQALMILNCKEEI